MIVFIMTQDGADQLAVLDSILSGESRSGILISASPIRAAEHALSQGLKRFVFCLFEQLCK